MNLIDCHSHSHNSPDADKNALAVRMAERAKELGLSAYAITDHCEVSQWYSIEHYGFEPNGYDDYNYDKMFESSMQENQKTKEIIGNSFNFICGIELGQATHDFELAEKIVSDKRLDFVIGSTHKLPNYDDFAFIDYSKYDIPDLMEKYFDETYKLCKWGKFDVLGHLTYTLRYIEGDNGIKVNMDPYEEIIRESFKLLVENGKGIEINTSGLRQKYGKTFPDFKWVKIFKELGGEIISIGSDSHCPEDIGKGIKEGAEIAKETGFSYLCYFKERKPQFIKIG